jgi:hypothetical protein
MKVAMPVVTTMVVEAAVEVMQGSLGDILDLWPLQKDVDGVLW